MNFRRKKKLVLVYSLIIIVFLTNLGKVRIYGSNATSNIMDGMSILYLAADGFDEQEYLEASQLFEGFGCSSTLAAPETTITSYLNAQFNADILTTQVVVSDYDCIFVPGGGGPDNLIMESEVLTLIQSANALNICLAGVCGGPLVFAAAGVVAGKNVTGDPSIEGDVTSAGGTYLEETLIVDGNLVTAYYPHTFACCLGILQVLGLYEDDPPFVELVDYTITTNGDKYNCEFQFEITDVFGIELATIYAYQLPDDYSERLLFKQAILRDENDDGIYICTITEFENYNYEFKLTVKDGLRNPYMNESILAFNPAETNSLGLNLGIICGLFVVAILPIILTKRLKK